MHILHMLVTWWQVLVILFMSFFWFLYDSWYSGQRVTTSVQEGVGLEEEDVHTGFAPLRYMMDELSLKWTFLKFLMSSFCQVLFRREFNLAQFSQWQFPIQVECLKAQLRYSHGCIRQGAGVQHLSNRCGIGHTSKCWLFAIERYRKYLEHLWNLWLRDIAKRKTSRKSRTQPKGSYRKTPAFQLERLQRCSCIFTSSCGPIQFCEYQWRLGAS